MNAYPKSDSPVDPAFADVPRLNRAWDTLIADFRRGITHLGAKLYDGDSTPVLGWVGAEDGQPLHFSDRPGVTMRWYLSRSADKPGQQFAIDNTVTVTVTEPISRPQQAQYLQAVFGRLTDDMASGEHEWRVCTYPEPIAEAFWPAR